MRDQGLSRVVSSSCSFATNLIAPFVHSLVTAGGFQFHHPLIFFNFFCGGRIPKLYIYKTKIFE